MGDFKTLYLVQIRKMKVFHMELLNLFSNQNCIDISQSTCLLENGATGLVTLTQQICDGVQSVKITGNIKCTDDDNCANDNHGFHVHQNAPTRVNGIYDCGTAGGHFAAENQVHGRPSSSKRHYGDLGNILLVDKNHDLNITDEIISLDPNDEEYIGDRGIVLHQLPDDFSGASGNAGGRVACCQISEPKSLIKEDDKDNSATVDELALGLIFGQAIVH